jgi:hypothetical protein
MTLRELSISKYRTFTTIRIVPVLVEIGAAGAIG